MELRINHVRVNRAQPVRRVSMFCPLYFIRLDRQNEILSSLTKPKTQNVYGCAESLRRTQDVLFATITKNGVDYLSRHM